MVIMQGDVFWADLGPPRGSAPAEVRPVLVLQHDRYNASRIATTVVLTISGNTELARFQGNVFLPAGLIGLPRDAVVNVTAVATIDKSDLREHVGRVPDHVLDQVHTGFWGVVGT